MNYNYITSAALDVGLALSAIIIFFCVSLPGGAMTAWWGTTVIETADYDFTAVSKTVDASKGEYFGPRTWKW